MAETESEFQGYTGDCVWAAVHMGAHRLAPTSWPVPDRATLDWLTSSAIAAGIGVGSQGQANLVQLTTMLERWGMRYSLPVPNTGATIPSAQLQQLLDAALARGKPVLLGFSNGQALAGDEAGLHGHEIAVLHAASGAAGYACGDGDNPRCAAGQLVYYPLSMLEAAAVNSAVVLEEVPQMAWTQQSDGSGKDAQGHTCGGAMMAYLAARPALAAADGLMSETYFSQNDAFLPLASGPIVTAHHDATEGWVVGEQGAQVLVSIWHLYQQALAQTAHPVAPAVKAAVTAAQAQLATALAALA